MTALNTDSLPRDVNEEKRVLGGILSYPDTLDEVSYLWPTDFFHSTARRIYRALLALREDNAYIDAGTVAHRASIPEETLQDWLLECPRAAVKDHATIVQKLSMQRALMEAGADIYAEAQNWDSNAAALQAWAEERVSRSARSGHELLSIRDILNDLTTNLETRNNGITISRGYPAIDNLAGGMETRTVEIIAGRPHAGKTQFAINTTLNMARDGKRVLYLPLEESAETVTYRLLHLMTTDMNGMAVPVNTIKSHNWRSQEDLIRVRLAAEELQSLPITFMDNWVTTTPEIVSACRLSARDGLDMVVLDHIQLIADSGDASSRNEQLSHASRTLKLTARALDTRVMVLSQLSREIVHRQNEMDYRLSDLRDCGSLEQDADRVMFIHSPLYAESTRGPYDVKVLVKKNRPTGTLGTVTLKAMKTTVNGYPGSYRLYNDLERINVTV